MYNWQIGPLLVNGLILLIVCFAFGGWLATRFVLRKFPEKEKLLSTLFHAVVIGVLVWKGSLLLFDPLSVIQQPLSLLLLDGGYRGRILAICCAIGYCLFQFYQVRFPWKSMYALGLTYGVSGWSFVQGALLLILEGRSVFFWASWIVNVLFLIVLLIVDPIRRSSLGIQVGIWYAISQTIVMFFHEQRILFWLSLSELQLLFLCVASCLIVWSYFDREPSSVDS